MSEWQYIMGSGREHSSYGSCVRLRNNDLCQAHLYHEHKISGSDTLQGISLKYEISIEELRRINKLFGSDDSIHLRESLLVPVNNVKKTSKKVDRTASAKEDNHGEFVVRKSKTENTSAKNSLDESLSPVSFLQKIDSTILESKKAVNSFCQDRKKYNDV